jgi:AbrB family transcriptional regulator (stage V sporulation protein T)
MKATGIVRRIDDLGRVVIPKEIRRTLRIREGDPLEIFVDREGEVILKKYSPIGELGDFAKEYAESLHESTGHIALIADRDIIVAVAGAPKKAIEDRRTVLMPKPGDHKYCETCAVLDEEGECDFSAQVIAPIIAEGDPIGAVILTSREPGVVMGDMEVKIAETAAGFLAKQMEQ